MNKRALIILSLMIIVLLAIIAYFLFFFKFPGAEKNIFAPAPAKQEQTPAQDSLPAISTPIIGQEPDRVAPVAPPPSSDEVLKYTLLKTAASFAERLGSYSNQGNYENITNLKLLMTASMRKWADSYVAAAKKTPGDINVYQGITTHSINSEIIKFDSVKGVADMTIHTQRVNFGGADSSSSAYNQDILISFIKEGGQWLVDNAKWQDKK